MSETRLIDDCFLHDKDRLRHDEALDLLRERLVCVAGKETVDASAALGRILAEDIHAPHAVPLHTNAAVDGYAFRHTDLAGAAEDTPFPISARVAAGDLSPAPLPADAVVRIFTGAPMPPGADSVAMQEDCGLEDDGNVHLPRGLKEGANCRKAGEDLKAGETVATAGTRLRAVDLAALASIGIGRIGVFRRLRVAILSSGNELRQPEHSANLQAGEVYDANRPLLANLLALLPVIITDLGIIGDKKELVLDTLSEAARRHDVIITTGGASRGDEDYMLTALDALGKRHMWQLAIKPGRPMMFGQIPYQGGDCVFLGLPGNPVAAMICFLLYARPALLRLGGANWSEPPRFPLPTAFEISKKKPDRREFLRGILKTNGDGLSIDKFARDGSGLISSLREADGLVEIPEDVTKVAKGDTVSFIPFSSFN